MIIMKLISVVRCVENLASYWENINAKFCVYCVGKCS